MTTPQDDKLPYAEKIAKLLRLAESTTNEAEAEAFTAKAQQLMTTWAIDDAMLALAEGRQEQDVVVSERIHYFGIFHTALFDIGNAVARANDCRTLITKGDKSNTYLTVIGFQSDVKNVQLLDGSLQVQATMAMQRWFNRQDTYGLSKMDKFKMRRQFYMSFAQGLSTKLALAKKAGVNDAVTNEAARSSTDVDTARKSTDLVIQSKTRRVDEWLDTKYGSTLRSVRRNYSYGGGNAANAGYEAGRNADIGSPRLGGRREIGR